MESKEDIEFPLAIGNSIQHLFKWTKHMIFLKGNGQEAKETLPFWTILG